MAKISMKVIKSITVMQKAALAARRRGLRIAFVPTMGALHDGHLALVKRARRLGDLVVVSIFVNPAQFGPHEDFRLYPRTFRQDRRKLAKLGVDYLFYPDAGDIYPDGYETYVELKDLSFRLEGAFRPGHFRGVATIVSKLFIIVQPDYALFGRKDYQQSIVIKKMVRDLNLPVKVVILPTIREKNGLAMSSRNNYLDAEQRERAAVLYQSLRMAKKMIRNGERRAVKIIGALTEYISRVRGTRIDYVAITDDRDLKPLKKLAGRFTVSLAVRLDGIRLIDNIGIGIME